jgi:hypothetical protein
MGDLQNELQLPLIAFGGASYGSDKNLYRKWHGAEFDS